MRKPKYTPDYSWIDNDPAEEEIDHNPDGSVFIPVFHVESKLTRLDSHWGTENFKFQLLKSASGLMFADGSLELVVTYGGRTRRLVGAATMLVPADTDFTDPFVNSNFSATLKSECCKNSVKPIGKSFGQALNDRDVISSPANKAPVKGKQKPPAVKMKADEKIQQQYNNAMEIGATGLVAALDIIYEISYTGNKLPVNAQS